MKQLITYLYKKPALLFLLFAIIAFLPALLPFFYIKNDLVTQILPTRFIISESIHSGFSPWWNPYINFGIPAYGDMNCGFWNPVLWIVASLFHYNIWTITFEEIFYIFLSGWGMFLVLKELSVSKKISILSGFSYMCSGYILGHMQHFCWITGAAFFPYVFLYFVRINKTPSIKYLVTGAVFSFLFLSSTHPGLIIGSIYFFVFSVFAILLFKNSILRGKIHSSVLRNNISFLLLTIILSFCVIISYAEIIPFITRGEKLSNTDTIFNATTLQSYISLVFPLIVHKTSFFDTDISMRNVYIGFFCLPGLLFFYKNFNRKIGLYVFFCLAFFILLSSGGFLKTIANKIVPFASYVRSAGEFSLFSVFILIICGALGFQFINNRKTIAFKWSTGFKTAVAIFIVTLITSVLFIFINKESVLFFSKSFPLVNIKEKIKYILDESSVWDLLLIQSCINLVTIYFLNSAFAKQNKFRIASVISINLIVICWLTLPFTGVGAKAKKEVNAILSPVPEGIHNQSLASINDFKVADENYIAFTGLPYTYMKKMGTPQWNPYPIELNTNFNYFEDNQSVKFINQHSFLFLSNDTSISAKVNNDTSAINVITTGPGYIKASVQNNQFSYITLLQNDFPYWNVFINGEKINHFTGYKTFISVEIPKKDFTIEYKFIPRRIILLTWINIGILLLALCFVLFLYRRSSPAKNNS